MTDKLPDDMVEFLPVGVSGHAEPATHDTVLGVPPAQTTRPCQVHRRHIPPSHINEVHHVWPLGHDGPDIPENKIVVCATGHNSIHDALAKLLAADGKVDPEVLRTYSQGERKYAKLGYQRIVRGAM